MSFDRLAPYYRGMEAVLAGGIMQRCRTAFLRDIPAPQNILLLGEGNGRCLVELLRAHPTARFVCVDASARMLDCAGKRLRRHGLNPDRVEFVQANILEWAPPPATFDLLVTHFFLDCFRPDQLTDIVSRLATAAAPGAQWLLADFCEPAAGPAKWRARAILTSLYLFFRQATRLPASQLTPPDPYLSARGFVLRERRKFDWGLLHSDLWMNVTPAHQG